MSVLFVTKDMASAPATVLAKVLVDRGHTVEVVCEGLSSALWYKAGFHPRFVGSVNFKAEPFTLDAGTVLDAVRPRMLVASEGNPINLEEAFTHAANARGIPVAFLEDFWNGFRRNAGRPDLILTIDSYAATLAREARPEVRVAIVGSGQGTVNDVTLPPAFADRVRALKAAHGPLILYVGGETTEDLALIIQCMQRTRGFIVPRFHPKHKGFILGDGRTREALWRQMLEKLGERVQWFDSASISELVVASDLVCSGLTLTLIEAVARRRSAVALQTPEVSRLLDSIVGLTVFPLVPLGLAHSIDAPADLGALVGHLRGEPKTLLVPFDAEVAYQALKEYL